MPHKSYVAGDHVLANDFNPNVADQVVASFANAAARASAWPAPPVGACSTLIDAANLGRLWVWTGTQWVPPWGTAWGVLDFKVAGAVQTINAWTDVTGLSSTLTYLANRRIKLTAYGQMQGTSSAIVAGMNLMEGATVLGGSNSTSEAANHPVSQWPVAIVTPTAGAHTYKVQAQTGSANGQMIYYATTPAFLLVEDVGPAGPPA